MTLAAIAALGLLGGCREQAKPDEQPNEPVVAPVEAKRALEVGVSGCAGLVEEARRGHLCLVRPAKKAKPLHLWLDGASDPQVELRLDGVPVEAKRTVDVDGVMLSVELPVQQGRLELSTNDGIWAIELLPVTDRFEALREEVQASWKQGDAAAAIARFESGLNELGDAEAAMLACSVGKVVLATGDYDRALTIAEQVSRSSAISCVGKASLMAAYIQIYLRPDFNAAELSLRTAEAVQGFDLDARIGAAYLRGGLEHWLGNIDESLANFERSGRLAWLVGDNDQYASALVMQAITLIRLGRFAEADALAKDVEKRAAELQHPTLALDIRSTMAWITVLRREDDPTIPDPTADLREMIGTYAARDDSRNLNSRRLELVLTSVQNSELDEAALELARIDRSTLDPDLLVWFELASARINFGGGRFDEAELHLDRAELLSELNQDRELYWRVTVARGDLERSRGRVDAALQRYTAASRLADELAMAVAGDAGRSRFVTSHSMADTALIELFLDKGDAEAAMCTAMAARARHLRGLWARLRPSLPADVERHYRDLLSRHREHKQAIAAELQNSWTLSTAELETEREQIQAESERADKLLTEATALLERGAPMWSCERSLPAQSGEAVLVMAPTSDGDSWTVMFALRSDSGELTIETMRVSLANGDAYGAADTILDEFATGFQRAQKVRVIPVGAFMPVEFHRLWFMRGHVGPTITYSLGLGTISGISTEPERTAAVVAGSRDLAAAAREAATVDERLRSLGWAVSDRWGLDQAVQPTLLHYAGHGVGGSKLGWDSAIELPEIGRISAAQIVAGQRSPHVVVLGACSAARVSSDSIDGGMNLAAAFLLAGAQLVIAPTRDVDDDAARELGVALYREFHVANSEELARALSRIQREQLGASVTAETETVSAWRAWTP